MASRQQDQNKLQDETSELRSRLEETEETLRAIRQYMVDAFVIHRADGEQVVTLSDADFPYRTMVESMNEGAVTLIPDGTIFYCNQYFSKMVQVEIDKLVGTPFRDLIATDNQATFDKILKEAGQESQREQFCLKAGGEKCVPVQLSIYRLRKDESNGISIIATDISERIESAAKIRSLASKLTLVEQEERHRISQVLHDDLQQRLFAVKAQIPLLFDFLGKDSIPAEVFSELDQIQALLAETITITRNMSIDLSPVVLQGEGLADAMSWLAFRMKEQYGLHIDLDAQESFITLDHHVRMLIFQVIRELLFNVVKHAGVTEAKVTMEQLDGRGRITVSDEGKGFEADVVLKDVKTAHGLLIVQDRLSLLGCGMQIHSQPGAGTRVVLDLPVEVIGR